jgi:hypothetical protein
MLASRLQRFPPWLRLVATTRPEPTVLRRLRALKTRTIDAEAPQNRTDVRRFIGKRLTKPRLEGAIWRGHLPAWRIEEVLLKASAGNFLFVTKSLEAVEAGHLTFAEVETMPPGLGSLYGVFFDRLYSKNGVGFEPARKVLQVIVTAQDPPTRSVIARALGMDADDELPAILERLSSFVPAREGRYMVFHKSLSDWLTGWDTEIDQPITDSYHVSLRKDHEQWANYWMPAYRSTMLSPPLVLSLPTHLAGAERWDDLAQVLLDWRFLEAKIAGPQTTVVDLQRDCAMAVARMPTDHPKRRLVAALRDAIVRQSQNLRRNDLSPLDQLELQADLDRSRELKELLSDSARGAREGFELVWTTYAPDPAYRCSWRLSPDYVHSLSMSADGRLAACGDDEGDVIVFDLNDGEVMHRLGGHVGRTRDCVISASGSRAVSRGDERDAVFVWDLSSGALVRVLPLQGMDPWSFKLSADGKHLLTCNHGEGAPLLSLWDLDESTRYRDLDAPDVDRAWCCAMAADAPRLLSAHRDGKLVLWT